MSTDRLAHDRIGESAARWRELRPIYMRIQKLHRGLVTKRGKAPGAKWPEYAQSTAGEIAASLKVTPEQIVEAITECGYWMTVVGDPSAPKSTWIIEEDGE
jgi:hypothetical protein